MSQIDQDEILMVLLAQQGDVAAFEELLRRLHGPLRQYVNSDGRGIGRRRRDAGFCNPAIPKYPLSPRPAVFRAWAFRIATRIALTYLKRGERWRQLENDPDLIRAIAAGPSSEHEHIRLRLSGVDRSRIAGEPGGVAVALRTTSFAGRDRGDS
jgi:DNA-directed RNA polymerase specialized sigma24 family protein